MGKNRSAKDLAFDKERAKYRQQIRELTHRLEVRDTHVYELEMGLAERDDIIRQQKEWIERLLEFANLSKEEQELLINKERTATELTKVMAPLVTLSRIVGKSPYLSVFEDLVRSGHETDNCKG